MSVSTYGLTTQFANLTPDSTYYAQVKAVNHSGINTIYLNLGSTKTNAANSPTGFVFTNAALNNLTATWNLSTPAGQSYVMRVSTANDFS